MIGSLNKIWPWKNTLEWGLDRHGDKVAVLQENVLPGQLQEGNAQVLFASILAIVGFAIIVLLESWASKKQDA